MNKIKIGVADDHPIVLLGVTRMLQDSPDIEIRFTADNIDRLLSLLAEKPVDLLLCDYEFEDDPPVDGLRLLGQIKRVAPHTKVVFIRQYTAPGLVSAALKAGAAGFIGKAQADFDNLVDAIRTAHNQPIHLQNAATKKLGAKNDADLAGIVQDLSI